MQDELKSERLADTADKLSLTMALSIPADRLHFFGGFVRHVLLPMPLLMHKLRALAKLWPPNARPTGLYLPAGKMSP